MDIDLSNLSSYSPMRHFSRAFSWLDLEMVEFALHDMVVTAVSQVMIASEAKGVRIIYDVSDDSMSEGVYGDNLRLQQILADFLLVSVKSSPAGGQIELAVNLAKDQLGKSLHVIHLELRYNTVNGFLGVHLILMIIL